MFKWIKDLKKGIAKRSGSGFWAGVGTVLLVIMTIALIAALVFGIWALSAWVFMLLFNVVANYFGFKEITFWISFAIVMLLGFIGKGSSSSKS